MLYRYFTRYRTYKYLHVLQHFVNSYNATPHRSLNGTAPKDLSKDNQADLFAYMYLGNLLNPHIKNLLNKKIKKRSKYRFKIGSLVRISHKTELFKRAYRQQWSSEIFKVHKRFLMQDIPQYQLIDFLNDPIKGTFYQSELQRVDNDDSSLWFIEKQLRKRKRAGQIEVCGFLNQTSKT